MLYSILVLGAAQGLFLALLLVSKRIGSTANKVLAASMVVYSVYIASAVYYGRSLFLEYPHLIGTTEPVVFLFGPLIYLYTRIVSSGESTFRTKYWLHFLPFFVYTLYLVPIFLMEVPAKIELVEQVIRDEGPLDLAIANQLKFVHGITYVVMTFLVLRRHEVRIRNQFSDIEKINLHWLRNLMIGTIAVWMIATGLNVLDLLGLSAINEEQMVTLAISVLIYAIGYLGLRQPEILGRAALLPSPLDPTVEAVDLQRANTTSSDVRSVAQDTAMASTQYVRSGLSEQDAEHYVASLLAFMEEEQPYLRGDLTLGDLADKLSISAHNLSEVINTRLEKNFYDFVNGYRVQEVQRKLTNPSHKHFTIMALAYDAGFNSKSAFNSFFKKSTGMTPSEYRKKGRLAA